MPDYVEISFDGVKVETAKAYGITDPSDPEDVACWLPKSQTKEIDTDEGTAIVQQWWAEKNEEHINIEGTA